MKKISNVFHQAELTLVIFWVIFAAIALKLEKLGQPFQVSIHVHPCHSLQKMTGNSFNSFRSRRLEIMGAGKNAARERVTRVSLARPRL